MSNLSKDDIKADLALHRPALEYGPRDPRGEWLLVWLAIIGLFALGLCVVVLADGGVYVGRTQAGLALGLAVVWLGVSWLFAGRP